MKQMSIFLLIALSILILPSQSQFNSGCLASCPYVLAPVCTGNDRYINQCVASCHSTANPLRVACTDPRIRNTYTQSGKICNCPLITQYTCITKKANGTYPNPCFAHCQWPKTGYGDYKKCNGPSGVNTGGTVIVSTNSLYKTNLTCNCNTNYAPVCINGIQFTNSCYATCYQPQSATSTCVVRYNFLSLPRNQNSCVCIYSVSPVCVNGNRYANSCLAACDFPNGPFFPC